MITITITIVIIMYEDGARMPMCLCAQCTAPYVTAWFMSSVVIVQPELEIDRARKEEVVTPRKHLKQRKRINRIPSNWKDAVFTRCVYCPLLCYLSFLFISSSGGSASAHSMAEQNTAWHSGMTVHHDGLQSGLGQPVSADVSWLSMCETWRVMACQAWWAQDSLPRWATLQCVL